MKSFISAGILGVSLALSGNAAIAATQADPLPNTAQGLHARPPVHVAARKLQPRGRLDVDLSQFVRGMLGGGPIPYANLIRDVRSMPASSGSSNYSPSYDYSSTAPAGCAACDAQAAADEENQQIQEMNDINAQTASMAAAEEENDEANAATLQTEINAGM